VPKYFGLWRQSNVDVFRCYYYKPDRVSLRSGSALINYSDALINDSFYVVGKWYDITGFSSAVYFSPRFSIKVVNKNMIYISLNDDHKYFFIYNKINNDPYYFPKKYEGFTGD
jgi:hypothetical protein